METALRKTVAVATIGLLGALTGESSFAQEGTFHRLNGAQIQASFSGMELTDEIHWREVYDRSGTLTTYEMGRKRVGKWRVEANRLCTDLGQEGGIGCYEVWLSGKKIELRRDASDRLPLEGVLQKPTGR